MLLKNTKLNVSLAAFFGCFVLLLSFGLILNSQVFAQTNENQTLSAVEELDSKAELVEIKQLSEKDLRNKINEIELEKSTLQKEVIDLKSKRDELNNTQQRLKQLQKDQNENGATNSPDEIPVIQNLQPDIDQASNEFIEVEKQLAKKQSRLEALQSNLFLTQQQLGEKSQEVDYALNDLQAQLISISSRYSIYLLLVVSYFVGLQLFHIALDKLITKEGIRDVLKFISTSLIIIATIITLLFAFVGNLTYLLTGLGVISAALVVALQDFVSSFFAFIWIKFKSMFKTRDIIHINSSEGKVTGIVSNIGIFRTTLKELVGEDELSSERLTGRTISIPNSVVLRTPVINYTQDNRLLWHKLTIAITYESDFEKAGQLLDTIAQKQFEYALDHKDQLLDDAFNLKHIYRPKVYMNIGNNGPQFEIWFATRYGHYYEVTQTLSADILKTFKVYGIDLSYNTSRIIATPHDPKDPHLTLHDASSIYYS